MGLLCSICRRNRKKKIVLLLAGLDNAGKTVAGRGLAGESDKGVVPTMGFSVIHLRYRDFVIKIFDLGGGVSIRGIWEKYFADVHGIIFVIDASDLTRMDEAKSVFETLISHEKISGKPVLLLANKQDDESALDEIEIIETLDLESIVNMKRCPTLVECCAAKHKRNNKHKIDPAIKRGYEWLVNYIINNYKEINTRVEKDTQEQKIIDYHLMKQKAERIKHQNENSYLNGVIKYSVESEKKNKHDKSENGIIHLPGTVLDQVHHANMKYENTPPVSSRPSSAVQLVRQQLILHDETKSSNRSKNKTYPMQLYNARTHSASVQRKVFKQQRNIKSAGAVGSLNT